MHPEVEFSYTNGNPEGVLDGDFGALVVDASGGAPGVRYRKTTAAGTRTGWVNDTASGSGVDQTARDAAAAAQSTANGGVQMRTVSVTLSRIVGGVAAQPATQTNAMSDFANDGDIITVVKTGAGADTIIFECDANNDGVSGGSTSLGAGLSDTRDIAAALPALFVTAFGTALVATWNSGTNELTIATGATGTGEGFTLTGSGTAGIVKFNMSAGGSNAIAATGARAARFLPAESGKKHVFLRVTHDFGATPDWAASINVGYAAFTAGSGGTAGSPLDAPFAIAGTGGPQADVTAPVLPPVASLQVPPTNTDATAWMSGADETVSTNPLTITALIATMPA